MSETRIPAEEITVTAENGVCTITVKNLWEVSLGIPAAPQSPKEIAIWADNFARMAKKWAFRDHGIDLEVDSLALAVQIGRAVLPAPKECPHE